MRRNPEPRAQSAQTSLDSEKEAAMIDQTWIEVFKKEVARFKLEQNSQVVFTFLKKKSSEIENNQLPDDFDLLRALGSTFFDLWVDVSNRSGREGFEFSDEDREHCDRVGNRIRGHRWGLYKKSRSARGESGDPEKPPPTINRDFVDYLDALSDSQDPVANHILSCRVIEDGDLPDDIQFLQRLEELLHNSAKRIPTPRDRKKTDEWNRHYAAAFGKLRDRWEKLRKGQE